MADGNTGMIMATGAQTDAPSDFFGCAGSAYSAAGIPTRSVGGLQIVKSVQLSQGDFQIPRSASTS